MRFPANLSGSGGARVEIEDRLLFDPYSTITP
jgi:hypothetical protein